VLCSMRLSFERVQECLWVPAAGLVLGACGSSPSGSSGHTPLPVVAYGGGSLLTAPVPVMVTFAGDALASQLESFGSSLMSSTWWNTVRAGMCAGATGPCVGDGGPGVSVAIPTPASARYTDSATGGPSTLQTWLAGAISSGILPAPGAGAVSNSIYVVFLPQTTSVSLDGQTSCADGSFVGYHAWLTLGAQQIPYAVVVECPTLAPAFPSVQATTLLEQTTIAASHEIVEAASDPIPPTGYALDATNTANWGWLDLTGGGELADMCVDLLGLNQDHASDGVFVAQRVWSNARAAANQDPCVPPLAGATYFNVAPRQSFFVLPVGGSATFEADAFSLAPMSDWSLLPQDWSDSTTSYLSFSLEGATSTEAGPVVQANDGATVRITVTLTKDPGALDVGEADGALVSFSGDPDAPTAAHFWPFAVMSDADAADAGVTAGTAQARNRFAAESRLMRRRSPELDAFAERRAQALLGFQKKLQAR
jgi:hypothetical protein